VGAPAGVVLVLLVLVLLLLLLLLVPLLLGLLVLVPLLLGLEVLVLLQGLLLPLVFRPLPAAFPQPGHAAETQSE